MGVADRKERERVELRSKNLGAAKELFLDRGFKKTSIRNIAELIEHSPGIIYLYFKDKNEDLF
jgi:AcrR family transcriptional regulator